MARLIRKSVLANELGVNPSTITKVARTRLAPAVRGRLIDREHPAVLAYVEDHRAAAPDANGMDPRYNEAVEACRAGDRWTRGYIEKSLGVGTARAAKLLAVMRENGVIPKDVPPPRVTTPPPPPQTTPYRRGGAARRAKIKDEAPMEVQPREYPRYVEAYLDWTVKKICDVFGSEVQFLEFLKAAKMIEDIAEKRIKNAATAGELIRRDLVAAGVIDVFNSGHLRMMTDGAKSIAAGAVAKAAAGAELQEIENYVSDAMGSFIRPLKNRVARALASG